MQGFRARPQGGHGAADIAARLPWVPRVHAQHVEHIPEVEAHSLHVQQHLPRPWGRAGKRLGRQGAQGASGAGAQVQQGARGLQGATQQLGAVQQAAVHCCAMHAVHVVLHVDTGERWAR